MRRLACALVLILPALAHAADRPNVLIVMTDDQGFGDLGAHGNPIIRTPRLDAFAKESVWLKNFYVSPVCSPTRSSLLTGLYNYRTGVVDTYIGRSMMRPDVRTLPEFLAAAGYRTGLFGKWHLGDNYPLRPEDRGFQETLWSQGGGLAQPSDHPDMAANSAYFDPILKRNGKEVKVRGYCTDVFTDGALKFITAKSQKPFFAYVAFNAPHSPYQVPEQWVKPYAARDLTENSFPKIGQPWAGKKLNATDIAKAYGMIENIDSNFGRLMKALEDAKLAENTIVIFLTDNGPGGVRWNAGLRNRKGTVYEGGIRVPCYLRWAGQVKDLDPIEVPLAHIDIVPTVLESCGVKGEGFDGRSFLRVPPGGFAARTLFTQWHRGDEPEKYRAFAARGPRYKLVQASGVQPGAKWKPKYELFDIIADPYEEKDLAAEKPDEVAKLKKEYDAWFADVTKKGFAPPRIAIGNEKENPVRLSRQDWRGPNAGWAPDSEGSWEIWVERDGRYRITVRSRTEFDEYSIGYSPLQRNLVRVEGGGKLSRTANSAATEVVLKRSQGSLGAHVGTGEKSRGPQYVEVEYLGPAR